MHSNRDISLSARRLLLLAVVRVRSAKQTSGICSVGIYQMYSWVLI